MFSYYGGKANIVKAYPRPLFPLIIEPFCGSARYALRYATSKVWINDRSTDIYRIWKYLVSVSRERILQLPDLHAGDDLREIQNLSQDERLLLGFACGRGVASPRSTCTDWGGGAPGGQLPMSYTLKDRIIKNLEFIRHWKVTCLDYQEVPNQEATWFVDPPYQIGGEHYPQKIEDYTNLGKWCKSRLGQVIVCENQEADWLPFRPLVTGFGGRARGNKDKTEVVWTNCESDDFEKPKSLFD